VNKIQLIILAVEGGLVATAAILTIWAVSAQVDGCVGPTGCICMFAVCICNSGQSAFSRLRLCQLAVAMQVAFRRYAVYCVFMLVPSGTYICWQVQHE
jgi:hypothetical protein